MGRTIYPKGSLILVHCVDDPAQVRTKVEKPVLGPKRQILVNAALQLHNLHRNLSIMETLQVQVYWMLVHLIQKVLSSATLSNVIFCGSFLVKNHFVCVPSTTADCNLFNNHRNKKVVGGNYNVLVYYKNARAPHSEGVVLCNNFK